MQNEAQYDLDRKISKISALSSNNLDKYEYLTGEDLGLKPSTVGQTKFEYFSLSKIINKGLDKDNNNKKRLFKRLKNIENAQKGLIGGDDKDKDKKKQKQINSNIDTKPPNAFNYLKSLSQQAKDLMDETEEANKDIDYNKLLFTVSNRRNLTLKLIRCHYIFSQLFIMVKFH